MHFTRILAGFLAFLMLALSSPASGQSVTIMPLGDSITEAGHLDATYRYWLWHELVAAGYDRVEFVGSKTGVFQPGIPLYQDFDQDHSGFGGAMTWELLEGVDELAREFKPDIVLLHIGTNNLRIGLGVASALDDVEDIITAIRSGSPTTQILIAQIIPGDNPFMATNVPAFNQGILTIAENLSTDTSPIWAVDQFTGFDPIVDTHPDGLHPNRYGEIKMANRWFQALANCIDCSSENMRLVVSQQQGPGSLEFRTFGGPAGDNYLTVFTFDRPQRRDSRRRTFRGSVHQRPGGPDLPEHRPPLHRSARADGHGIRGFPDQHLQSVGQERRSSASPTLSRRMRSIRRPAPSPSASFWSRIEGPTRSRGKVHVSTQKLRPAGDRSLLLP